MAGIYLHIPFCSKACHYCDFHFSVSLRQREAVLEAMRTELRRQKDFLGGAPIDTIYFGGGTPSILSAGELNSLLETIAAEYSLSPDVNSCLEANPEQLDADYLGALRSIGIDRLSIGVQSFDPEVLKWMNRSHDAEQSTKAVLAAAAAGFESLTIDLIYGIPGMTPSDWEAALKQAIALPIDHLSAYSLTLEERTPYAHYVRKGTYRPPDDEGAVAQFRLLQRYFDSAPWEQYEISNFARDGAYSRHNTSYWKGIPYLGIGPSAHSFDGRVRAWNRASNAAYIQAMEQGGSVQSSEVLDDADHFNEYLLTGLRTKWGISLRRLREGHPQPELMERILEEHLEKGHVRMDGERLVLSSEGMLFADGISADLFVDHSSHTSS